MMRSARILGFGLATALLPGCGSSDRVAGGGVTEVPNNVSARVLDAAGVPVGGASVSVIPADGWLTLLDAGIPGPRWDTLVTDDVGLVRSTLPDRSRLWVRWNGDQAITQSWRPDSAATLRLRPSASVRGTLPRREGRYPDRVVFQGAPWLAAVDSTGSFHLDSLPAGRYRMLVRYPSGVSVRWLEAEAVVLVPGSSVDLQPELLEDEMVIDDFSDGDLYPSSRDHFGFGQWQIAEFRGTRTGNSSWTDEIWGASTSSSTRLFARADQDSRGSLHASFPALNPGNRERLQTAFAPGCGTSLGTADTLAITARGKGVWRVGFETMTSNGPGNWYGLVPFEDSTEHARISIRDLQANGQGVNLSRVCHLWIAPDEMSLGRSLEIQEIRIRGVRLEQMLP